MLPSALIAMANECKCVFDGACSCELELKFMTCIRDACASGKCGCDAHHWLGACHAMAATCPQDGLQCTEERSSCGGFAVTRPGSTASMEISDVAPMEVESQAWLPNVTKVPQLSLRRRLMGSAVYVVFGVLVAYIYYKQYVAKLKESCGETHATTWFKMKRPPVLQPNKFNTSLFDCFHDPRLCFLSCCCGCIVWAHTMDFQFRKRWTYWSAFAISFFLLVIYPYTAGISALAITIMGTIARQAMRQQYRIDSCTPKTIIGDFFTWLCCTPCAIVQEHCESHYHAEQSYANTAPYK